MMIEVRIVNSTELHKFVLEVLWPFLIQKMRRNIDIDSSEGAIHLAGL